MCFFLSTSVPCVHFCQEAPLPKTIPSDYEEIFTGLKNDIAKFRADFLKYLDKKGKELSDKVKQLEKDLKKLEEELAEYVLLL